MLQYVLHRFYRIYVWSIAIPSKDIYHPFAGFDVFDYVLHSEFSEYASVFLVGFFVALITCILCIGVTIGFVISLGLLRGQASLCLWRTCFELLSHQL